MLSITIIIRLYIITICKKQLTNWRKITEFVIIKSQINNILSNYIYLNDIIYLNYYNEIVIRNFIKF